MKCKNCEQKIKVEVKLVSFLNNEMFIQCPYCSELISENCYPNELDIIRLTYDEEK